MFQRIIFLAPIENIISEGITTTAGMFFLLLIHTAVLWIVETQHNLTPFGNASQSSVVAAAGRPENAINPPISNVFSYSDCSHTKVDPENTAAWWMFKLSYGATYIQNITIYYRENFAHRMDGFKLYVTNTSTIPPDGYLCYEDPDPGLPSITQTIPCNQLGRYVIYYDDTGSLERVGNFTRPDGPVVELCYVAIYGCQKTFWGSDCDKNCSENCIDQHCYPQNGSCVWGFHTRNCSNDVCDNYTVVCTDDFSANKEENISLLSTQIGFFTGGVLFGALIASTVCILVIKKRTRRKKHGNIDVTKTSQSHEQQHGDDVRMENVSTYQDLTNDIMPNDYDQINTTYVNH
ncbi:uncharacterized protein LOC143044513 isoform X1 [Mytilus galloprovincialis]|uniref:uncharacterized protein LOC143044513 isoform X1 n=1 Tax=Mytilus galloprovincialis TaxID=29158 RepID=UPI003F7BA934